MLVFNLLFIFTTEVRTVQRRHGERTGYKEREPDTRHSGTFFKNQCKGNIKSRPVVAVRGGLSRGSGERHHFTALAARASKASFSASSTRDWRSRFS